MRNRRSDIIISTAAIFIGLIFMANHMFGDYSRDVVGFLWTCLFVGFTGSAAVEWFINAGPTKGWVWSLAAGLIFLPFIIFALLVL